MVIVDKYIPLQMVINSLVLTSNIIKIYSFYLGGISWTQTKAPTYSWWSICSDATGQYLAAGQFSGTIYTSSDGYYFKFLITNY